MEVQMQGDDRAARRPVDGCERTMTSCARASRHVGGRRRIVGRARRVRRRARRGVTARMLELAAPQPGRAGARAGLRTGRPGLAAAARVLPDGEVVLSDVVAGDDGDRRRARRALGLATSARACSTSRRSTSRTRRYDVVLCREGLMFAVDPARAAREIRAGAAAGRARRGRGVGPARAQPVARHRLRRGQRPARQAGAAARRSEPVLARRRRPARAALLAGGRALRRGRRASSRPRARGLVRRVVEQDARRSPGP